MLVIDDAKLPPPKPASAAHARYGHKGRPGLASNHIVPSVGISSTNAENTVQLRPPKVAVASVYGMRRHAPTSVAVAPSRNLSPAEKPYTDSGMNSTITDQMDQIEKPMCSATTDQIRLRRAMYLLPASHATVSSGTQSVMRCDMSPTLGTLYCPKVPRDNPVVNFRSPLRGRSCEV